MIWNSHLCLCYCFYQLGLCSVSYAANYSIYRFCITIKDFHFFFFFKSDCCPRLRNCNFLCVICIQADLLCYFLLNKKRLGVSSQFGSLFILYISTAKPFSLLVKRYIEVEINKHGIRYALIEPTLRCLKYIKGMFNPYAFWHSYLFIPQHLL